MHLDLDDFLAQTGIVASPSFDHDLMQVLETAPDDRGMAPAAGLPELVEDGQDPQLVAYWMWVYGTPPDMTRADVPGEYVAPAAARCGSDFVEGTEYLTQVQVREYLESGCANDNWLMRRVK